MTFLSGPPVDVLVAVVLVAAASTVAMVAVTSMLLPTVGLPALTLPFNLVTLGTPLAVHGVSAVEPATPSPPALPSAVADPGPLDTAALAGACCAGWGRCSSPRVPLPKR